MYKTTSPLLRFVVALVFIKKKKLTTSNFVYRYKSQWNVFFVRKSFFFYTFRIIIMNFIFTHITPIVSQVDWYMAIKINNIIESINNLHKFVYICSHRYFLRDKQAFYIVYHDYYYLFWNTMQFARKNCFFMI